MKMKKFFCAVVFSLITTLGFAGGEWVFFAGPGMAYYQGDLNSNSLPRTQILNMSIKGGVAYNFHPRFGVALHYTQSSLNGSDFYNSSNDLAQRGLSFTSPLKEFGLNLRVRNLFGKNERLINYMFTGVNYFLFNPTVTKANVENYVPESGYSKSGVNVPFGLGLGYWVTPQIGIVWETGLHILYTDYLDGVSEQGNPVYKDAFVDSHILVFFRLGKPAKFNNGKGFRMPKSGPIGCRSF